MLITKRRVALALILIFAAIFLFYFFVKNKKEIPVNAISVTAAKVQKKDVTIRAHAIGNVVPYLSVSVRSRVDGQLLEVGFKEGDYIKEGQKIFQIDQRPFQVASDQAAASLLRDQAQLENYKNILKRYTSLTNKGYISKQDFDQANANVKSQEAMIEADKATLANAKLNLNYATIVAPISGRTGSLLINQGNLVKMTDSNPLVIINQITPIYVNFALPEQQLPYIQQAMQNGSVAVSFQRQGQNTVLQGKLSFIDNAVNTDTGTIQLKALYDNTKEELWPGSYVNVSLPMYDIHDALVVPTRAIQAAPDGSFVFVVNSDSEVHKKMIKVGPEVVGDTVIVDGLKEGERVVTTGQIQLIDGSKVQIKG